MPITFVTFGLGYLAIIGVPPFSGFFSKDKIIEAAFDGTGWQPWVFGLAALLGAGDHGVLHDPPGRHDLLRRARAGHEDVHPHESPLVDDRSR